MTKDEVCPNCGKFVTHLVERTGWCTTCTGTKSCSKCGREFVPDYSARKDCTSCRQHDPKIKAARRKICPVCTKRKPCDYLLCQDCLEIMRENGILAKADMVTAAHRWTKIKRSKWIIKQMKELQHD